MQKRPIFWLFSFCNPSRYRKHASNLNVEGVNLNVIIMHEYSLIFLHIVRNFAFMSDFGKLRYFLIVFDSFWWFFTFCFLSRWVISCVIIFFCWRGANKTQRPFERIFFIRSFFYCWCSNVVAIMSIMTVMERFIVLYNEPQK